MKPKRPNTSKKGAHFEDVAVSYLKKQGLEIIDRNVHMRFAEIDIIAKEGDILCFVEVRGKKSSRYGLPEATIDLRKKTKIIKAASAYLQRLYPSIPVCRFDVVSVENDDNTSKVNYFRNAFSLNDIYPQRQRRGPWQVY